MLLSSEFRTIIEPSSSLIALKTAESTVSPGFIFSDKGRERFRTLPFDNSWCDSTRTLLSFPITRTTTTSTVRIGGVESANEVSPSEISSQRLLTFLVPGLTPQEAKESEGNRGLSQSERDCGVGKGRLGFLSRFDEGMDMVGILRNLRGLRGKESFWRMLLAGFEGDRRMKTDRAVKMNNKQRRKCAVKRIKYTQRFGHGDLEILRN
nr:hypothetical protein VIGAN_02168500 [Ipomoea batatas]